MFTGVHVFRKSEGIVPVQAWVITGLKDGVKVSCEVPHMVANTLNTRFDDNENVYRISYMYADNQYSRSHEITCIYNMPIDILFNNDIEQMEWYRVSFKVKDNTLVRFLSFELSIGRHYPPHEKINPEWLKSIYPIIE